MTGVALALLALLLLVVGFRWSSPQAISGIDEQFASSGPVATTPGDGLGSGHSESAMPVISVDVSSVAGRPDPRFDASRYPLKDYSALRDLAMSGDGDAAVLLSGWLEQCKSEPPPETEDAFNRAMDDIRTTYRVRTFSNGVESYATLANPTEKQIELAVEAARMAREACNDLSIEQRNEADEWLVRGVEAGSTRGHLRLAKLLDASEGIALLHEKWEEGDPRALYEMAMILDREYENGNWPDAKPKALAARIVHLSVFDALLAELSDGENLQSTSARKQRELFDEQYSLLLPHQRVEAIGYAKMLMEASGENCCISPFLRETTDKPK